MSDISQINIFNGLFCFFKEELTRGFDASYASLILFLNFASPSCLEDLQNSNITYVDNKVCLPLLHLGKAIIQGRSLMTGKVWRFEGLPRTSFWMFQLLLHI